MQDRLNTSRFVSRRRGRRTWTRGRWIVWQGTVAAALAWLAASTALAQDMTIAPPEEMATGMNAAMDGWDPGAPPVMGMGGGSFYSQDLGTTVRARWSTRSYGQEEGNLDIGTMQVVSFEDAIAFFDGQVTLNDVQGVGFNLGLGYRWLNFDPFGMGYGRILGVSIWGDGTSTEANNFFPQLGVSLESLGETWDLRANAYIPIGQDSQVGKFVPTGEIGFQQHFISELAEATVDHSYYAAEIEAARRLGRERDAWAFAGPYVLANDDDDTAGWRAGFRGYAYPDLLLQIAVSDDDIFKTNTTFSIVWFIGRTRTNFQPACGLPDRFREPVMRNDYVVLSQSTAFGGSPLTDATTGNPFRVTHVDSNAAPGGDGTFERPLNNLDDIQTQSLAGDIVYAHAESEFDGQSAVLLANQRFLGEGNGIEHTIDTTQKGVIPIPETFPGATNAARPIIMNSPGDAVTLTDRNEVSNFTIDGGTRAIVAGPNGAGNPLLADLTIRNTTGSAIVLTPFVRTDTNDEDNDGNTTERTVAFNVTIRDVTFDSIGGDDIDLNAATIDVTQPNVTLQEAISLSDIVSTNGGGRGLRVRNTHSAGTLSLTNYENTDATVGATAGRLDFSDVAGDVTMNNVDIIGGAGYALAFLNVDSTTAVTVTGLDYDGMTGAAGALLADTYDGTFNISSSTLQNGTLNGIRILNETDGTFTFANSVTMTNLGNQAGSIAFEIDGGATDQFTGTVTVNNAITNALGRAVAVSNMSGDAAVTFVGNITDTGQGILINGNTDGILLFSGTLDLDTTTSNAVLATNNTGTDISFGGRLDITTTTGDGFVATGGGTLTASNTNNSVRTETGRLVQIENMTIASGAGVVFDEVDRTTAGAATSAIQLVSNTGGPITIGTITDDPGTSTIEGGTVAAVRIENSANVTLSNVTINNGTNAVAGVAVTKSTAPAMTLNLNDLITNGGDFGIDVVGTGGSGGALTMSINDAMINGPALVGLRFNDVDNGTVNVNGTTVDGNNAAATAGVQIIGSNATFNFDADTNITEVSGTDFFVSGGAGTINMAGDITNTASRAIEVSNITGGTVNFTGDVTDTNGTGILVNGNTGGTANFTGDYNLSTGANVAVTITNNTGATINIGQLDITTTTGNGFLATGGGTLSVIGTDNKITSAGGRALHIDGMTIGAVDFESINANGGDNGIRLVNNTGGVITIGDTGNVAGAGGTIQNTTDAGIHVTNSNVTLNGVTVQNAGNAVGENGIEIFHDNSSNVSANLNRVTVTNNNAVAGRNGIRIDGTGNTGTLNANVQNLTVNVQGDGLVVNDGVNLTAGGTNNITTETGVGLTLTDVTIAGAANFARVTVNNGATNGIVMQNVTGGQVAVTGTGSTGGSGGTLNTTGNAIVLTNVENVDLSNITVTNSGANGLVIEHDNSATTAMDVTVNNFFMDDATGAGVLVTANDNSDFTLRLLGSNIDSNVAMTATGAGDFFLLVQNTTVDTHIGQGDVGFALNFMGSLDNADVTLRNLDVVADDASALSISSSGGTPKVFDLLIDQGSSFTNDDAASAALIQATGGTTINASIYDNAFTNNGAGEAFEMVANGASVRARLDLDGNTADAGVGNFILNNVGSASTFEVFDLTNTFNNSRNSGTVVPQPNAGAFQNRVLPVPLPTIP